MHPETPERLLAEDVTGAATGVALFDDHLEDVAEVDGFPRIVVRQHVAHVLHDHVRVVVRLHEPVGVVEVVVVDVPEGLHGLGGQVLPPFRYVQPHSGEGGVPRRAHEQQLVHALAPRVAHVHGFLIQVLGRRHDPHQHRRTCEELFGHGIVVCNTPNALISSLKGTWSAAAS